MQSTPWQAFYIDIQAIRTTSSTQFLKPDKPFPDGPQNGGVTPWRSLLAQSFLETQEIKARSWADRSQKVFLSLRPGTRASAGSVHHKHGQAMEENLSENISEWGTDTYQLMESVVLMILKVKGKKEMATVNEIWFTSVSHFSLLTQYSHVQFKSVCVYMYIISAQGETMSSERHNSISWAGLVLLRRGTVLWLLTRKEHPYASKTMSDVFW